MEIGATFARMISLILSVVALALAAPCIAQDFPAGPPEDTAMVVATSGDSIDHAKSKDTSVRKNQIWAMEKPLAKTIGDRLWFYGGTLPLQHGPEGQPEIFVKSILLGGAEITYDGLPFIAQGAYMPQRTGTDLNVLMFENLSSAKITSSGYLDAFSQGTVLSLKSAAWPPPSNPSSITVARGPYGYERTTWRFSKNFDPQLAATFGVGFKKSRGYYTAGADYDGFGVAGSLAGRIRSRARFHYQFYENKSDQGLLQFDRVVPPSGKMSRDIIRHQIHLEMPAGDIIMFSDLLYQKNKSKLDCPYYSSVYWPADRMGLFSGGAAFKIPRQKIRLVFGYDQREQLGFTESKALEGLSLFASDSISISKSDLALLSLRWRHRKIAKSGGSIAIGYEKRGEDFRLGIHSGYHDRDPDPFATIFESPVFSVNYSGTVEISEYRIEKSRSLSPTGTRYLAIDGNIRLIEGIEADLSISLEKVSNDVYWHLSDSSGIWSARPNVIGYNRATFTAALNKAIGGFLNSSAGITSFVYDPAKTSFGEKHSPTIIGFAESDFTWKEALKNVDLNAVAQFRYVGRRYYYGFIQDSYKPAVVLDCGVGLRYSAFDFNLNFSNVIDFFATNEYKIWGEYIMPPASVWWVFNWRFDN